MPKTLLEVRDSESTWMNMQRNVLPHLNQIGQVGLLIAMGLLVRLPNLLELGLWRDEGSTYFDILPTEWGEVIQTIIYSELNPPAFFIAMHQWMQWFGTNEVVFKLPAFIFGVLLIPAIYGLGCAAYSKTTGVLAAAIATFAPDAIYYSQEARPYTLTALLCCLTMTFYFKLLKSPRQRITQLGFIVCGALLLYSQYTGALLIVSLGITTLYLWWRPQTIPLGPFVWVFGMIGAFFLPWIPVFLTHLAIGSPWAPKASWLFRPVIMLSQLLYTMLIPTAGSFFTAAVLVIAIILGLQQFRQPSRPFLKSRLSLQPATLVSGLNVVLPATMLAILSYDTYRYMLAFSPLAWVMYAQGLERLLRHINLKWKEPSSQLQRHTIWVTLLFFLVVPSTIDAFSPGITAKSGIRAIAAEMQTQPQDQTLYLLSPDFFGPTFGYYFANTNPEFHGFARWDHPERFSPQGYAELWDRPTLLQDTMQRIQTQANRGYRILALIQSQRGIGDGGKLKFSRANDLLTELKQRYPLLNKKDYPASKEPITLYSFSLTSP
jgi:Dolichyl-phosphate-mannose-protein mannosyltransferase